MQRSIRLRLNDIIQAMDGTDLTIGGVGFNTFQTVYHMPRTVERCIEIISEASRRVPADLKSLHPEIPWTTVAAIGNIFRHDYDEVYSPLVWEIITEHLPALRRAINNLLRRTRRKRRASRS